MCGSCRTTEYILPFFKEKMRIWFYIGFFLVLFFYSYFVSPLGFQGSIYRLGKTVSAIEDANFSFIIPVLTFLIFYDILSFDKNYEYLKSKSSAMIKVRSIRWITSLIITLIILSICFLITFSEKIIFEKVLPNSEFILTLIKYNILIPLFLISIFSFVVMILGNLISNEFLVFLLSTGIWILIQMKISLIFGVVLLLFLIGFTFLKLPIKRAAQKTPTSVIFLFLTLVLGYLFVKNLRYDKTSIAYTLFEVIYPYIFSFVGFGILNEEKKNKLLERLSIIPDVLPYLFRQRLKRAITIWFVLGIIGFFLFLPLLKQNNYLILVLCLFSNTLFWSGIYFLNESIGRNKLFGVLISFILFVFWLLPRVQQLIGNFSVYRYLNPFYLTFNYSSHGWIEKLTLGLIGITLYSFSYIILKRKIFINDLYKN